MNEHYRRLLEVWMRKQGVSFRAEVTQRFQFLVDEYGLDGPDYSEVLLPSATYSGAGLAISIFLQDDTRDGAGRRISVRVQLDTDEGPVQADLDELVEAAVFAPRHTVGSKAHTGEAVRATLDDNAQWIRRLWPILRGPEALDTLRTATRFETDKGGNPKRRAKGIKWKYK
ncbi:hypothetical protein QLQ12_36285 [Actinoplanes sp. NEAU-A12]|uniref:Uncharacterized protein n=2 Tax=Actinoplanes sandaracinus TaxID=3045177 RepID=A0ABT6WWE0_9ACTN|nr:hypothetical protein [Actinoplanes sandaracinus]